MTAIRHPTGFITRPDATLRRRVCRGTARAIELLALLVIVGAVLGVAAVGAIVGAVLAGAAIGIPAHNTVQFAADAQGTADAYRSMSVMSTAYRTGAS